MPSLNLSPTHERSIPSLEQEIMRLQEVLKDREREISLLEESLKESQQDKQPSSAGSDSNPDDVCEVDEEPLITDAMLSPKTLNQFDHIRKTMEGANGHTVYAEIPEDESLERLNELMLYVVLKSNVVTN
jgi:kinesin family protein 4/21/27